MRPLTPAALCMLMLVTATGSAVAQTAGRPYRGLFGSGVGDASQVLSVSASLGGGYDDDVLAEATGEGGVSDPSAARSSGYGSFKGGLRYSLNRRRVSFGVSAGSSVRLYSDEIGGHVATHSVNTGGSFQLARRTSVTLSQRVSYQPFLTILPFPHVFDPDLGDIPPPQPELATADTAYIVYSSSANLSQQLSRRGSLGVSYSYSKSDFTHDEAHFSTQTGGVRYSHALAKGLGAYVGYSYTDAQHTNGNNVTGQGLDAGIDYSRALSVSRHTTLTFGTGSTAVTDGVFTQYYVTGNASLAHQIGRTWSASLTYARSAQFLEAFSEPYFADTAAAGLTGLLHRRPAASTLTQQRQM
jgi:hypothetical protein